MLLHAQSNNARIACVLALGLLLVGQVSAQVFKCTVAGKPIYQQFPCESGQGIALMTKAQTVLPLWVMLTSGMTEAQVRSHVPEVQSGDGDTLQRGAAVALLQRPEMEFAGQKFRARFFFKGQGFYRVNYTGERNRSNEPNQKSFEQLVAQFTADYGKPIEHKLDQMPRGGLSGRASWQIPQGEVWVVLVPIQANTSLLNFGFLPQ